MKPACIEAEAHLEPRTFRQLYKKMKEGRRRRRRLRLSQRVVGREHATPPVATNKQNERRDRWRERAWRGADKERDFSKVVRYEPSSPQGRRP